MATLSSADKMVSRKSEGQFIAVTLRREDEAGIAFLGCDEMPELFIAVKSDDEIRNAIDCGLKGAFSKDGRQVQVFTNGKIAEPSISVVVRLIDAH